MSLKDTINGPGIRVIWVLELLRPNAGRRPGAAKTMRRTCLLRHRHHRSLPHHLHPVPPPPSGAVRPWHLPLRNIRPLCSVIHFWVLHLLQPNSCLRYTHLSILRRHPALPVCSTATRSSSFCSDFLRLALTSRLDRALRLYLRSLWTPACLVLALPALKTLRDLSAAYIHRTGKTRCSSAIMLETLRLRKALQTRSFRISTVSIPKTGTSAN